MPRNETTCTCVSVHKLAVASTEQAAAKWRGRNSLPQTHMHRRHSALPQTKPMPAPLTLRWRILLINTASLYNCCMIGSGSSSWKSVQPRGGCKRQLTTARHFTLVADRLAASEVKPPQSVTPADFIRALAAGLGANLLAHPAERPPALWLQPSCCSTSLDRPARKSWLGQGLLSKSCLTHHDYAKQGRSSRLKVKA